MAAIMYTTGGKVWMLELTAVVDVGAWYVGVDDTVSVIATLRRRIPSSCFKKKKKLLHNFLQIQSVSIHLEVSNIFFY